MSDSAVGSEIGYLCDRDLPRNRTDSHAKGRSAECLPKPFDAKVLVECLNKALGTN
jgi:hypothetical protein